MNPADILCPDSGATYLPSLLRLFYRWAFRALSVGGISVLTALPVRAECDWPPLNAIEKQDTQTIIVRGVLFTSGFRSWHVPQYHLGEFRCETSISVRERSWSFVFNAPKDGQSRWLLEEPGVAGTPGGSATFAPLADVKPLSPLTTELPPLAPAARWNSALQELPPLPELP